MADDKNSRQSFLKFREESVAVELSQLSPMKSGKQFFNAKLCVFIQPTRKLEFEPSDEVDDLSIADIIQFLPDNVFSIVGGIKWAEYSRSVNVRGYQKTLREGKVIDKSNKAINITVWGSELIN